MDLDGLETKTVVVYMRRSLSVMSEVAENHTPQIARIFEKLKTARNSGSTVYLMGNGGSASTASHFAADLLKTSLIKGGPRFRAISLNDNIPVMLAWANDLSYEDVFSSQLESFVRSGDVVVGISGSGNSKNVLKAMDLARQSGAVTVGLTGMGGGNLKSVCDECLIVPDDDMMIIESVHLSVCHALTSMFRKEGVPLQSY